MANGNPTAFYFLKGLEGIMQGIRQKKLLEMQREAIQEKAGYEREQNIFDLLGDPDFLKYQTPQGFEQIGQFMQQRGIPGQVGPQAPEDIDVGDYTKLLEVYQRADEPLKQELEKRYGDRVNFGELKTKEPTETDKLKMELTKAQTDAYKALAEQRRRRDSLSNKTLSEMGEQELVDMMGDLSRQLDNYTDDIGDPLSGFEDDIKETQELIRNVRKEVTKRRGIKGATREKYQLEGYGEFTKQELLDAGWTGEQIKQLGAGK